MMHLYAERSNLNAEIAGLRAEADEMDDIGMRDVARTLRAKAEGLQGRADLLTDLIEEKGE